MHVAIEAVGIKQGGGVVVLNGLVRALVDDRRFDRVTVFCSPQKRFDAPRAEGAGLIWRAMSIEDRSYAGRLAWLKRGLAHATNRLGADVVLCLNGVGECDVPRVNYIQQSLYFDEDALVKMSAMQRFKYRTLAGMAERSANEAAFLVVQTEWMRKRVKSAWDMWANVAPPTPPKIAEPFTPQRRVVWIGNELAYKNRQDATAASLILSERGVATTFAESGENSQTREEIKQLLRSSVGLANTSLAESYPLPLVEAMAWSCPIVTIDKPYARDLCDDAAIYYSEGDTRALAGVMMDLVEDAGLRNSLIARGHARANYLRNLVGDQQVCDLLFEAAR